jgi:hypothetical protein
MRDSITKDWIFQQYIKELLNRGSSTADYYEEDGKRVFTADYHKKRGYCCGSGCRHCPYNPRHVKGTTDYL